MEAEIDFQTAQGDLSDQLEGFEATLALKAALLQQADGGAGMGGEAALQAQLDELNSQLAAATAEKEALVAQIGALKEAPAAAQRGRMAKLEKQVAALQAAKEKQAALVRNAQASERRVKELRDEVDEIKAHKAALARRMREASDAHRTQKMAREREVKALRRKGERTAAQLSKLEGEHAKQAAVLKRKHEEVAAMQKRQRAQESGAAARRPGGTAGFGGGATASSQARLDGRKGLDATILGAKPKDWLAAEVGTAVAQQKLRDQVAFQVEIRRQASLKLQALDALIAELAGAADGGDGVASKVNAFEATARAAEAEALRTKVAHHTSELQGLQKQLLGQESAEAAAQAKLEALSSLPHAREVAKAAFPKLVALQARLDRKEEQLSAKGKALHEATDQLNLARLAHLKEKREADEASRRAQRALAEQVETLQAALGEARASAAAAPPPPPPPPSAEEVEAAAAEVEARRLAVLEQKLQERRAKEEEAKMEVDDEEESEEEGWTESEEESEDDDEEEAGASSDENWSDTEEAVEVGAVRRTRGGNAAERRLTPLRRRRDGPGTLAARPPCREG